MLYTNHSSRYGIDTPISETSFDRIPTLEELVLTLLEGEFAGVIRSHIRGETYGGC